VAIARNHLQVISLRRCFVDDVDVTDRGRGQIKDDVEQLLVIMAACRALHAADVSALPGERKN